MFTKTKWIKYIWLQSSIDIKYLLLIYLKLVLYDYLYQLRDCLDHFFQELMLKLSLILEICIHTEKQHYNKIWYYLKFIYKQYTYFWNWINIHQIMNVNLIILKNFSSKKIGKFSSKIWAFFIDISWFLNNNQKHK